jgi:hypothetical protein
MYGAEQSQTAASDVRFDELEGWVPLNEAAGETQGAPPISSAADGVSGVLLSGVAQLPSLKWDVAGAFPSAVDPIYFVSSVLIVGS